MSSACYAGGFGATPVQEVSNGGNSFSCSGGGSTKRKSDAYLDAKVRDLVSMCASASAIPVLELTWVCVCL